MLNGSDAELLELKVADLNINRTHIHSSTQKLNNLKFHKIANSTKLSTNRSTADSSSRNVPAQTSEKLKLPLTPKVTLQQFKSLLTVYEQQEILDWPAVYFAGSATVEKIGTTKRKIGSDLHETYNIPGTNVDQDGVVYNHGFDDSRGDLYLTRHDHIAYRYEVLSLLGKGSFGQVVKCYDHKRRINVAIKVIRNKKRFEKQGVVEMNVLTRITDEDSKNCFNCIRVLDHFYFRGHLCFTFDLLGSNLYEWIKAGGFKGVHLGVIKRFAVQLLQSLEFLEKLKIIHCDLKPENILLKDPKILKPTSVDSNMYIANANRSSFTTKIPTDFNPNSPQYDIKVIDFGSSCYESERLYTYVQSRFYRSPEIILGLPYTMSIDIWSFGCVLAEIFTGYPLFPGENEIEQLACIMEVKGLPDPVLLSHGSRTRTFFDSSGAPRTLTNSKGKTRRPGTKTLSSILRCTDMAFLDFIEKCLIWNPAQRMKPSEALSHPFITGQRFIPQATSISLRKYPVKDQSVNIIAKPEKDSLTNPKPTLTRNKYASSITLNSNAGEPISSGVSNGKLASRSGLRHQSSFGTLVNRLPAVSSINRLGSNQNIALPYNPKPYSPATHVKGNPNIIDTLPPIQPTSAKTSFRSKQSLTASSNRRPYKTTTFDNSEQQSKNNSATNTKRFPQWR
ncbi:kinase-like domain-containing protein [Globomyces pollinis-pini]|nr:kinase-like domain-containing protein [Globomyces pollinis-pini]